MRWTCVPGLALFFLGLLGCGEPPPGNDAGIPDGAAADATVIPDATAIPDATVLADAAAPDAHDVLFVGNSYVYVNDVPGHYQALVAPLVPSVRIEEVTTGGYTWVRHAADAATEGTPLSRFLRTGTAAETSFDFVVLQEQSQIGGFPEGFSDRTTSVEAASSLAALATARGATVVLYLTWGRERGDELNPELYPTFTAMQDLLDRGYLSVAERLSSEGATVRLAPVGGGFRSVFEDVLASGADPLLEGSDFDALYEPDGSHPSLQGAYLSACIIAGTTTMADVHAFGDEPTLGAEVSSRLRDVCGRALLDPRWLFTAPLRADSTLEPAVPQRAGHFGYAVAVSADGGRALVGEPGAGIATVYTRDASGWSSEGVLGDGTILGFGDVVALSADGSRALVSAPHAEVDGVPDTGLVRVFVRSGTVWTEEGALVPSMPRGTQFGGALALDAAGDRAFVGAPVGVYFVGATASVRVFARSGTVWNEEAILGLSEGTAGDGVGAALACDATGSRVVVGASRSSIGGLGSAPIFSRSGTEWTLETTLERGGRTPDGFGVSVAMSGDGSVVLIGAPQVPLALVYRRDGLSWSPARSILLRGRGEGAAVALSGDGRWAVVGGPQLDTAFGAAAGSAWRFDLSTLSSPRALAPLAPAAGLRFGGAVALDEDGSHALVGMWGAGGELAVQAGAVAAFTAP